jgi:tRNA pseudouridine38-40 synthase
LRYFIVFSYFGKSYHGWQSQPNAITIQAVLEDSISKLLGIKIAVVGAGRTDAGVHAKQMYAHFDFEGELAFDDFVFRLNAFLPDDIAVASIHPVANDAHARFDAIERTYEYWITQSKNPFYIDTAHYVRHELDIDAMNKAAQIIQAHNDFECFSKSNTEVRTFLCKIKEAEWTLHTDTLVFRITADRFLRNMVRAIVGTLIDVGVGNKNLEDVRIILKGKDRSLAGASVPAKGLYLTKIVYPETIKGNE